DTSGLCDPTQPNGWTTGGQPAACVIKGTTITVNLTAVIGSRPLVLVATTSIAITTALDVSSSRLAGTSGPGVPFACTFATNPQNSNGAGGGGGAGGTFGSQGAAGGSGDGNNRNGGT